MKTILLSLALLPVSVRASELPTAAFQSVKLDLPALSLTQGALQAVPELATPFSRTSAPLSVRIVSRMPIVTPSSAIDPRMLREPDPTVDAKLRVKIPAVESLK